MAALLTPAERTAGLPGLGETGWAAVPGKFSGDEAMLLAILEKESLHIDELGRLLQWSASQVASILLSLELKGAVRQLPGKHFAIMMDGY